jgi:GTP-binding protein LepA
MQNIRNFVIIAHIDHGKSTLADRLLEKTDSIPYGQNKEQILDSMDLERERGITIKLQPARMKYVKEGQEYNLNLIDTPGHVDFSYEVNRSLAAVEGALLVVDATQGIQAQTIANLHLAQDHNLVIIPVINKIDLPNAEPERVALEICELLKVDENELIYASAKTGEGVEDILKAIVDRLPAPEIKVEEPLKALVFDSFYDAYRGVVAYVRIFTGQLSKRQKIELMASAAVSESEEVGAICLGYKPKETLKSGEIGYIVTGLKNVNYCRVGDTITLADNSASAPLSGYHEPQPMVFAAIFTQNGEAAQLRESLEKLKLNDAALAYEPTNSDAFGYGYRAGFLGLLHLEIIKERLEREYNLELIVTTPSVAYEKNLIGGTNVYSEPWVDLEIITPQAYVGAVMELIQSRRGIYKTMEYLNDRVILYYEAPLSSLIIDFYDQLKSASQGYASLAYHLTGYRPGDLVKMDILVAGDKVDVLSQIVPRSEMMHRAIALVKRLKDLIPKQLFEVSLQSAIGGKIIARENIPALRKDVIAKLYGGDITRKRKLLEKQKAGKKKMKQLGRVEIPSEVFIDLLKNNSK